jgi:hypothetical protein
MSAETPIDEVEVLENTPAGWRGFQDAGLDVVLDPMILRTGEMFLAGRSGAAAYSPDPEAVWAGIVRNLSALFSFFDLLVTRRRLPFLQYWETFFVMADTLPALLGSVLVPVRVDHDVYATVMKEVRQAVKSAPVEGLPEALVAEVADELGDMAYEWRPWLDVEYADPRRLRVAEFMAGGMVFGAYSQATGCDHIVQARRSRLFVALSLAEDTHTAWRGLSEERLFGDFRARCTAAGNVHAQEYPAAPTVLPYLLAQPPAVGSPRELLDRCLTLRESRDGERYRSWHKGLRDAWSLGQQEQPAARRAVADVLRELDKRLGTAGVSARETHVEIDAPPTLTAGVGFTGPVPHGSVSVQGVPLRRPSAPAWLRALAFERMPFRRHRRLLLRMALDEARYGDITLHLRRIWTST